MSYRSSSSGVSALVTIGICCACLFVSCGHSIDKGVNKRTVVATVTDKGIKNYDNDSKYLIFTKNESGDIETYEITDSLVAGRFNSSDVYAGIEVGKTYEFEVGGKRNTLLSWYPNIYTYKEIK